jgi:hypothetical protein
MSEADDDLEARIARLEEHLGLDEELSRRAALAAAVGAGGAGLLAGRADAGHTPSDGVVGDFAVLSGPLDSNGLPEADPSGRKRLIYVAPGEKLSTGGDRFFYTEWHDDQWFELNLGRTPWEDSDGDGLLETSADGHDVDRSVIRDRVQFPTGGGEDYQFEVVKGNFAVTASETGEVVGAFNEHGILLPTSPVFTSDTTVRSRTGIYQCDTSGLANSITLTIGTELENDSQIFAVKDVGGAASLNQIEVVPESGSDIDGQSSATINSNYGRLSAYYSETEGQWFSLFTSL